MDVVGARSVWYRGLPNGLSAHTRLGGTDHMADSTTTHLPVAGLDVHAASIRLAVVRERRAPRRAHLTLRLPAGRAVSCADSGPRESATKPAPTGFGLARHLRKAGLERDVVAPGLIPRRSSDRVKTDAPRRTQAGAALPGWDARADLGAERGAGGRA